MPTHFTEQGYRQGLLSTRLVFVIGMTLFSIFALLGYCIAYFGVAFTINTTTHHTILYEVHGDTDAVIHVDFDLDTGQKILAPLPWHREAHDSGLVNLLFLTARSFNLKTASYVESPISCAIVVDGHTVDSHHSSTGQVECITFTSIEGI
jgi:hypothetical protein